MTVDDIMALADKCYSRLDDSVWRWQLREAIEQALLQAHKEGFDAALLPGSVPDAQPVAWMYEGGNSKKVLFYKIGGIGGIPLYTHPPAPTTQEPVATHDVGSGGYSVLDCPHCLRTIHIKTAHPPAPTQREHITDGSPCWCSPDLDYVDPETGAKVWIHKNIQ